MPPVTERSPAPPALPDNSRAVEQAVPLAADSSAGTRNIPPVAETDPGPRQGTVIDSIASAPPSQAPAPLPQPSVPPPQAASPVVPADATPAEFVRRAQQEFDSGRVETALTILDNMRQRYPSGTDEAWWLYGQLLEANSPSRDVRLALEYYRRLVQEYPQSSRASDAQRRIAYLERFYFNIR